MGFAFRGFPVGAHGQIELFFKGHLVFTQMFDVPSPAGVEILQQVGTHIPHPRHRHDKIFHWTVGFRVTVQGFPGTLTGLANITCFCAGEGGGGGIGIGGGGVSGNDIGSSGAGGSGGSGVGSASPATPVSGQPGFTG